jgi:hypothetical protein
MAHYTTTQEGYTYDASSNTTVVYAGTKVADPIQIYWRAEDLTLFDYLYAAALASRLNINFATPSAGVLDATTTTVTRSAPTAILPASTPKIDGPTSTSTSASSPSSPDLSTAATAGVGVGAAIGGLILLAGSFLLFRRHRRRKSPSEPDQFEPTIASDPADGTDAPEPVVMEDEKHQVEPSELETREKIIELSSPVPEVAELDGAGAWRDRREWRERVEM